MAESISVVDGLRFAETIRNLDERSALKIALALAGSKPRLFQKLFDGIRMQNLVPPSTMKLSPVPANPVTPIKDEKVTV